MQQAIDETEAEDILQITQDYVQYEEVVIIENKNITLDLNGKTITTYGSIRNQGIFTIADNVGNGAITSKVEIRMIRNVGTVEVSGGTVSSSNSYGIYNEGVGTVEVSRRNG